MDLSNAGSSTFPQGNGTAIWPGTNFTGPLTAGNVMSSDGSGNLAGGGGTVGTANTGYALMTQTWPVTQTGTGNITVSNIVVPAQSQVTAVQVLITKAWDGGNSTFNIGTTGNSTAFGATGSVQGNATGQISITPAAGNATQIANWANVGATDVRFETVSVGSGNGTGLLTVSYIQGINN